MRARIAFSTNYSYICAIYALLASDLCWTDTAPYHWNENKLQE